MDPQEEGVHSEALTQALAGADAADKRLTRAIRRMVTLVVAVLAVVVALSLVAEVYLIRNQHDTHHLLHIVVTETGPAAHKAEQQLLLTIEHAIECEIIATRTTPATLPTFCAP